MQDLKEKYANGHRFLTEFKRLLGECRKGDFDTPALRAVKKRIKIKEWGKQTELATWKQVLDRLGENVAYAALRQGRLPYVPHSLLLPGHGVKWPDSHEFVLEKILARAMERGGRVANRRRRPQCRQNCN